MTLPVLLTHVAARWAVTRTPAHGWVPDESEIEMSEHLHYITHTHGAGYGVYSEFTCTGDRTAPCHMYPDCLCAVDQVPCDHEPAPHDECWRQGWMDEGCATECGPDGAPVRSGPITITWNGDCVTWKYAEGTTA